MKDYLEKAKDILYNISDYIIIFTIILTIGLIIGWRLDILFPQTTAMVEPTTLSKIEKTDSKMVEKPETKSETKPAETKVAEKEESIIIKVSIPKGTPSSNIGAILLDNGLVASTKEFENKVNELNLEKSLRSGEYNIKNDSSLEEIVKIIANQK